MKRYHLVKKFDEKLRTQAFNRFHREIFLKVFWPQTTEKSLNQLLAFLNSYHHATNFKFIPSVHFWDTVNFTVPWPDRPHRFLTMPTKHIYDQLLTFADLYQHVKKISLFHLPILQIQSILESHHHTAHTHFWQCSHQKVTIIFSFPWICTSRQKIS